MGDADSEDEDLFASIVGEEGDYYYDDDDEEQEDDEETDRLGAFFDETSETEWIINSESTNEFDQEWANADNWNEVGQFTTFSAKQLTKKCMTVFGKRLCLCEVMEWATNNKKHVCHPNKAKRQRQKEIKQIEKQLKKKEQQMKKKKSIKLKKIKKNKMLR